MNLENDQQLLSTQRKLALLEEQIANAKDRPPTPNNLESLQSLAQTANQLREEIIRYQSQHKRRASKPTGRGSRRRPEALLPSPAHPEPALPPKFPPNFHILYLTRS